MPSNETAKTKSGRSKLIRRLDVALLLFLLLASLAAGVFAVVATRPKTRPITRSYYTLRFGERQDDALQSKQPGALFYLKPAWTAAEQEQGLSNTSALAKDHGMLFINDRMSKRCFWMKDMNYPLDIIWTDTAKKVVHIEKNLSPDTYPQEYCASASYVIELNAGEADKNGIQPGQVLSF